MVFSVRNYDNGQKNNLKTITNFFYVISRQRELGEFVPVYTSETRKYDYEKSKLNFAKQEVMLKDLCRNEEHTQLKFELFEFKEEDLKPGQKTQQQLEEEKMERDAYGDEDYGDEFDEYGNEDGKPKEEQEA